MNARLPKNVVSIQQKRIKGRDFLHQQIALWSPELAKSYFLQDCGGECESVALLVSKIQDTLEEKQHIIIADPSYVIKS